MENSFITSRIKLKVTLTIFACVILSITSLYSSPQQSDKTKSVFFDSNVLEMLQNNLKNNEWAQGIQKECIEKAKPWMLFSDDEIWELVFGATISRSWMVWSNGFCPSCKNDVKMYGWIIDPFKAPWKVQCPHCKEMFPKNDFYSYYLSGMDEHFIFYPEKADQSLLTNLEHPQNSDSKYKFGVDDGEGFILGENRWRFIGAYLIYGQWKKLIIEGIRNLSNAYALTGDQRYAHKAGILLDRVADVYPSFDYSRQGFTYEKKDTSNANGYVSVWHDACRETRVLAIAYDQVFTGIQNDASLVTFLAAKAKMYKLENHKSGFKDIQQNIEDRILKDAVQNRYKIESNFPQTDITLILIQSILAWPDQKENIMASINEMIKRATAIDGLSGEKGLAAYSAHVPKILATFLAFYDRLDISLLATLLSNHPNLTKTFRFHINTWINQEYYPKIGDTGRFAEKTNQYVGTQFLKNPLGKSYLDFPFISNFKLFWRLFEITGDTAYVQLLFKGNENSIAGLPFDLFTTNSNKFQNDVKKIIDKVGDRLLIESVNMEDWCLALLRSGQGKDSRVLWVDYDIGGNHSHADGLNMGLFAKGLDLLPGFGYPPVQYGGWHSPKAIWYRKTAAHNTVVVDGKDQMVNVGQMEKEDMKWQLNPLKRHVKGKTGFWSIGKDFKAIRVDGKMLHEDGPLKQYERTLALVDISEKDSYVFDVFRIAGGKDHAKFIHGYLGELRTTGLSLKPASDFGHDTQMTNFKTDPSPSLVWSADWKIDDYYNYLKPDADVHLVYRDVTKGASASVADTWIAFGYDKDDAGIKSVMVRNQNKERATAFVGILEPYERSSHISAIKRLPLQTADGQSFSDMNAAVQVDLDNGDRDLLVSMDVDNPLNLPASFGQNSIVIQKEWNLETDAELLLVRMDGAGKIKKIALVNGSFVKLPGAKVELNRKAPIMEIKITGNQKKILTGDLDLVKNIIIDK